MQWFDVDKEGLRQLMERRGFGFMAYELYQNVRDLKQATECNVLFGPTGDGRDYELTFEDNDPAGFARLSDAFTLFAPSSKKSDPEMVGMFNLGEKLVLAMCKEATILSTTGGVRFDAKGRHKTTQRTSVGSVFRAIIGNVTKDRMAEFEEAIRKIILPARLRLTYNGETMPKRTPVRSFIATLGTVFADETGSIRPTRRQTTVDVYEVLPGESGTLYDQGIPVIVTGDRWHVSVNQRVPVNMERDNVQSPFSLQSLRALVVNEMKDHLTDADVTSNFVDDALQSKDLSPDALSRIMDRKFGAMRVSFNPTDPEANSRAAANGYTVVRGPQMPSLAWEKARESGLIKPSTDVSLGFATQKADVSLDSGVGSQSVMDKKLWSKGMTDVAEYIFKLGIKIMGREVSVNYINEPMAGTSVMGEGVLVLNVARFGRTFFDAPSMAEVDPLVIELFALHIEKNRMCDNFYKQCCQIGAKLRTLAFSDTSLRL